MKRPASKSGKQQRPSFSDATPTLFGIPKRSHAFDLLLTGGATLSAEDFIWGYEINGQPIPPLAERWLDVVHEQCPAELSAHSQQQLRAIIESYLVQRFALATSTSYHDLTSSLEKIEKAARDLLDAIEIYDHGNVLARRELEATLPPTLRRDDVYPVITMLINRAHIAAAAAKQKSEISESTFSPKKVWDDFVNGLAAVFNANGWDVKISKSRGDGEGVGIAHPSKFVNFVWAVLSCLPKELREHCSSRWTLANAMRPKKTL